jgi:LAS superfamily LD-carboxypeptidase LdcB
VAGKRVYVRDYGRLLVDDPRLQMVPSIRGRACLLHWAAAGALERLQAGWEAAGGSGRILVQSGWRPHRWTSRAHYEQTARQRYGTLAEGRKWIAYDSPHETGLAMDIGSLGLHPDRRTREAQRQTELYAWLVEAAEDHGWHPYLREPWHWECVVDRATWQAAEAEFVS